MPLVFLYTSSKMLSIVVLTLLTNTNYNIVPGYCHPYLLCPKNVPLAYLEIPRVACSSMKKLLSSVDGINFVGHGITKLPCCSAEPSDRIKYVVVRNPYDKLLSVYNHGIFCSKNREKYCRKPLSEENKDDFFRWFSETAKKFPNDNDDKSNHFKSQFSQFYDTRLSKPHDIQSFTILHLENIASDWESLNKKLCKEYDSCHPLPPLMISNNLKKTRGHNMSLIYKNETMKRLIYKRFKTDFDMFGYNMHQT